MSYTSWHVGMKVVCTDAQPLPGAQYPTHLEKGRIYTIRTIGNHQWDNAAPGVGIRVAEFKRPGGDYPWGAKRFCPIQHRKTYIEIFTRILRNPHIRIKEDA